MIIKASFRAEFSGMKGKLNPLGAKTGGVQTVEVYRRGANWYARFIEAGKTYPDLEQLGSAGGHASMKQAVEQNFTSQLSHWTLCENGRPLPAAAVQEDESGKFRLIAPTHVAGPEQNKPGNLFVTGCGLTVGAHQIREKRGEEKPTCPTCQEIWIKNRREAKLTR